MIKSLLGTASFFQSGGPGKGMHARMWNILNTNTTITAGTSVGYNFSNTGVFGVKMQGKAGSVCLINFSF